MTFTEIIDFNIYCLKFTMHFVFKSGAFLLFPICVVFLQTLVQLKLDMLGLSSREVSVPYLLIASLIFIKHATLFFTVVVAARFILNGGNLIEAISFDSKARKTLTKIFGAIVFVVFAIFCSISIYKNIDFVNSRFPIIIAVVFPILLFAATMKFRSINLFQLFGALTNQTTLSDKKSEVADTFMSKYSSIYMVVLFPLYLIIYSTYNLISKSEPNSIILVTFIYCFLVSIFVAMVGCAIALSFQQANNFANAEEFDNLFINRIAPRFSTK